MSEYKIAFVGTCCAGKTTLLDSLKIQIPPCIIVPEAARAFFEKNPDVDRTAAETQSRLLSHIINAEQQAAKQSPVAIFCDRAVIDPIVYLRVYKRTDVAKRLLEQTRDWISTYHTICLLDPTDVPYRQDEIRTETEKERDRLHQEFLTFFAETSVPYLLLSGNLEQRISTVRSLIKI